MVQINWTKQSVTDLKEIAAFISRDSDYYAKLQISRLRSKTNILETHIGIGSIVPEFHRKDIRQVKNYL